MAFASATARAVHSAAAAAVAVASHSRRGFGVLSSARATRALQAGHPASLAGESNTAKNWEVAPGPLLRGHGAVRGFRSSAPAENTWLIACASVGAAALLGRYALLAYEKANAPTGSDVSQPGEGDAASSSGGAASSSAGGQQQAEQAKAASSSHKGFGAEMFAKRFYRGGFEDKMTRREAALVLGVRESADPSRIRERHRKMLMANHPDMGGSTYLAGKINEAKDVLLKGKATS